MVKQRDTTFPDWITKTKSKRYIAICPICKESIGPVYQFRIQASERLRYHLSAKHNMTENEAKNEKQNKK